MVVVVGILIARWRGETQEWYMKVQSLLPDGRSEVVSELRSNLVEAEVFSHLKFALIRTILNNPEWTLFDIGRINMSCIMGR